MTDIDHKNDGLCFGVQLRALFGESDELVNNQPLEVASEGNYHCKNSAYSTLQHQMVGTYSHSKVLEFNSGLFLTLGLNVSAIST